MYYGWRKYNFGERRVGYEIPDLLKYKGMVYCSIVSSRVIKQKFTIIITHYFICLYRFHYDYHVKTYLLYILLPTTPRSYNIKLIAPASQDNMT